MNNDEEKKVADIIKDFSAKIDLLQRENAELLPYKDELLRLADAVGENDDPFAAWEHLEPAIERAEAAEAKVKRLSDDLSWYRSGTFAHAVNEHLADAGISINGDILHDCIQRSALAITGGEHHGN